VSDETIETLEDIREALDDVEPVLDRLPLGHMTDAEADAYALAGEILGTADALVEDETADAVFAFLQAVLEYPLRRLIQAALYWRRWSVMAQEGEIVVGPLGLGVEFEGRG